MSDKKILILVPGKEARGGITNYYGAIRQHFSDNVVYFTRGARTWPVRTGKISEGIRLANDYLNFLKALFKSDVALVQTTTAFDRKSIIRDGLFVLLAHLAGTRTIVFFRGWDDSFANNLGGITKVWFNHTVLKCDAIIDLSGKNLTRIKEMGYKGPTYLETTLVNEELVRDLNFEKQLELRKSRSQKNILFLSRIEREKGVFQILEAYTKAKGGCADISLTFAGDGSALEPLKEMVAENQILDVTFAGFVSGNEKKQLFLDAYMFVFLSEFEGMPNAVLEAMAFGLPVITTDVGGIYTVFKDGENGRLLADSSYELVSDCIIDILNNEVEYEKFSQNNYQKAKSTFWSSMVSERVKKIYQSVASE